GYAEGDRIRFHGRRSIISGGRQYGEVLADDGFKTFENRARDDRVADRDLIEMRKLAEDRQVVEIEVVAGVDAETERMRQARRVRVDCERLPRSLDAALVRAGERLGVELDAIGARLRRQANRLFLRIDKHAS